MAKENERIGWIDYLKGLAIITVVFLHSFNGYTTEGTITEMVLKYITSFHMALFFSISGYLFNRNIKDYKKQIKKKIRTLVIPYVIYGIVIGFLLENIRIIIRGHDFDLLVIIGNLLTFKTSYLAAWFLIVLFEVYLIEYLLNYLCEKYKVKNVYRDLIHIILLIIGFVSKNIELLDFYKIKLVFISCWFFHLGYILKKVKIKILSSIILILTGAFFCYLNKTCTYSNFDFGNPILFVISSGSSIAGWITLIKNICQKELTGINRVIKEFGIDSIIVLLTHSIFLYGFRMIEKFANMEIHTFPPYAIFVILVIIEIITIKYMPKILKKTFGK